MFHKVLFVFREYPGRVYWKKYKLTIIYLLNNIICFNEICSIMLCEHVLYEMRKFGSISFRQVI